MEPQLLEETQSSPGKSLVAALSNDVTRESSSPTPKKLISYEEYKKRTRGERGMTVDKSTLSLSKRNCDDVASESTGKGKINSIGEVSLQVDVSSSKQRIFSSDLTGQVESSETSNSLHKLSKDDMLAVEPMEMITSATEISNLHASTKEHERSKCFRGLQMMPS